MAAVKISACLVVINEERLIRRCLKSLVGIVDEIIVVHDGPCSDQTLDICRQFGASVWEKEFVGIAEPHRPFSYEQAQGEWILQIDADEFLSDDLRQNLRSLTTDSGIAAYEFTWPLWNGKREITRNWPYKRCFFRKDSLHFLGVPQFVAEISGRVERRNLVLRHEPEYNNYRWSRFNSKWRPWAKIQARYYSQDFGVIKKFNYSGSDWPQKILIRRRHPLILLPFDFCLVFVRTLFSGAWRSGLVGFKAALLQGTYRALVDYYVFKYKVKK
jgi:glycosyltransferase involved in cell wall biosynthesis